MLKSVQMNLSITAPIIMDGVGVGVGVIHVSNWT